MLSAKQQFRPGARAYICLFQCGEPQLLRLTGAQSKIWARKDMPKATGKAIRDGYMIMTAILLQGSRG